MTSFIQSDISPTGLFATLQSTPVNLLSKETVLCRPHRDGVTRLESPLKVVDPLIGLSLLTYAAPHI
jgi:hypothetical protein